MLEKPWRFQMLGTFEVYRDDIMLSGVHRNKHCQLLAFLAYTRGKDPRYKLASRFWPLSNDSDNNLSQAILKLTRILEIPRLTPETLLQSPGDGTVGLLSHLFTRDIDDFNQLLKGAENASDPAAKIERLVAAVKLYRGEFLLGYEVIQEQDESRMSRLEYDWIKKPRQDYQAKFVQVLTTLANIFNELSLPDLAIICEEHTANTSPLTTDECALLETWRTTRATEPTAPMTFSVLTPLSSSVIHPRAVASYNQGRYLWKIRAEQALLESTEWFQRAMEADSNYVLAYAGMANAYSLLGYYSYLKPGVAAAKAKYWMQEAWKRTGNATDAARSAVLTADAWIKMVYDWEWMEAEAAFIEALQLNPRNETAHQWYSFHLMLRGNTQQSLEEINTAWDLEPQSGILSKSVGERYHYKGLYATASEKYMDALTRAPRYCLTHYCLGKTREQQALLYRNAGLTEEAKDKLEEALGSFRRAIELSDVLDGPQNPALVAGIAHAYAKSGERAKSSALLKQLKEQRETEGCYVSPVALATVYLALEEHNNAMDCLDTALEERPGDLVLIHIDPRFLGLRENTRFAEIIKKIGIFH